MTLIPIDPSLTETTNRIKTDAKDGYLLRGPTWKFLMRSCRALSSTAKRFRATNTAARPDPRFTSWASCPLVPGPPAPSVEKVLILWRSDTRERGANE